MALKQFQFVEQFVNNFVEQFFHDMIFFEKTGSIGKIFEFLLRWEVRKLSFKFKSITFFVTTRNQSRFFLLFLQFSVLLFNNGVCIPFNKKMNFETNKNQTVKVMGIYGSPVSPIGDNYRAFFRIVNP